MPGSGQDVPGTGKSDTSDEGHPAPQESSLPEGIYAEFRARDVKPLQIHYRLKGAY